TVCAARRRSGAGRQRRAPVPSGRKDRAGSVACGRRAQRLDRQRLDRRGRGAWRSGTGQYLGGRPEGLQPDGRSASGGVAVAVDDAAGVERRVLIDAAPEDKELTPWHRLRPAPGRLWKTSRPYSPPPRSPRELPKAASVSSNDCADRSASG